MRKRKNKPTKTNKKTNTTGSNSGPERTLAAGLMVSNVTVDRSDVRTRVVKVLNETVPPGTTTVPDTDEGEKLKLWGDLNMTPMLRQGLAKPLTEVSSSFPGGFAISPQEAKALATVGKTIDLTLKRAQGKN